ASNQEDAAVAAVGAVTSAVAPGTVAAIGTVVGVGLAVGVALIIGMAGLALPGVPAAAAAVPSVARQARPPAFSRSGKYADLPKRLEITENHCDISTAPAAASISAISAVSSIGPAQVMAGTPGLAAIPGIIAFVPVAAVAAILPTQVIKLVTAVGVDLDVP